MTLSETHILKELNDDFFNIEGYTFVNKPRALGLGGGVAVYLKESIKWKRRFDLEKPDIENITLEIFPHKSKSQYTNHQKIQNISQKTLIIT